MTTPSEVPADDALAAFGPRVRRARLEKGLSARALAERLGISASAVSQIETGKIRPSMKRLHDIVSVLGLDLEHVFAPGDPAPAASSLPHPTPSAVDAGAAASVPAGLHTTPDAEHPRLVLEDGIEWFQLAPVALPQVEVLRTVYPPGARTGPDTEFVRHPGWELGYVISGRMAVQLAFTTRVVGPGDSICFDSAVPHKLSNPFDEPVVAVWVRGLGQAPGPQPLG